MALDSFPSPRFVKDGALLPGDIVLTTTPKPLSAAIRIAMNSDISHAMLCVADLSVIDSTGEGVHARNLQWMEIKPGCAFHVLRPGEPLSTEQVARAIRYARERIAMPYTQAGAVQSLFKKGVVTHHQFCSRLVAQAYRAAGVNLVPDADRCTPAELLKSPLLVEIPDVLRKVTAAEAAARAAHGDRTQLMRDAIKALVDGARKLSPAIETVNDIDQYLMRHPRADAALCVSAGVDPHFFAGQDAVF